MQSISLRVEAWMPKEVWGLILNTLIDHKVFYNPFTVRAHKTIIFARFPSLKNLVKDDKILLGGILPNPSRADLSARAAIRWIYGNPSFHATRETKEDILTIFNALKVPFNCFFE